MSYWQKNSGIIITVAIIIIIILIIYYWGKYSGKKYVPNDIVIPPDTQQSGSPSVYNPGPITDAIFQDLDEIWGVHEKDAYVAANKLSNSQLAAVYNDWNKRYSEKFDGKTIIQAIEDDFSFNQEWTIIVKQLVDRFKTLPGAQGRQITYYGNTN